MPTDAASPVSWGRNRIPAGSTSRPRDIAAVSLIHSRAPSLFTTTSRLPARNAPHHDGIGTRGNRRAR